MFVFHLCSVYLWPLASSHGLVVTKWGTFHDELHYQMLPELEAALDGYPVLQNAMNLSVDEIDELHEDGLVI